MTELSNVVNIISIRREKRLYTHVDRGSMCAPPKKVEEKKKEEEKKK
jgi:hypothetical protein